jgi:hypothetical protein
MPSGSQFEILSSVVLVALSALSIGSIAYLCARRRSVALFLASVILLWGVVAWVLGHDSSITSQFPGRIPEWRHVAAALLGLAPQVLLPAVFTIGPVFSRANMWLIPFLATAGAVLALPLTFYASLAASCYVALDCP